MNFLLSIIRRCPLLPIILKLINNERGQVAQQTGSSQIDPRMLDYFLGVSKPATGLLGEGAFSALGADPTQFMQASGLPAMAGAQDLFRTNPAEAEQMSLGESKARQNILNNTPMRGGELNQGLAQNAMHFGGLRQKLTEDRRNEALAALQGLSGFKIPSAPTSQEQGTRSGPSLLSSLLASPSAGSLLGLATQGITGLLGLGSGNFSGQPGNLLSGTGWENLNLTSPVDASMIDPFSSFAAGWDPTGGSFGGLF